MTTTTIRSTDTRLRVVVSGVASDSHTWNLVYLALLLREWGHDVHNIGSCVPTALLVHECLARRPDLVVLSSVNGHGAVDGRHSVRAVRSCPPLADVAVVIGGKLTTGGPPDDATVDGLRRAGFDAVFGDGDDLPGFESFVRGLVVRRPW